MAEERNYQLTGKVCREVPHQPELLGRRGRTRSCQSVCSTQPGPGRTQSPRWHHCCKPLFFVTSPQSAMQARELTSSCKHLQLIYSAWPRVRILRASLPSASPSLQFAGRRRRWLFSPVTVLALLQLSECPATPPASSAVALYPPESSNPPSLHPGTVLSC